MNTVLAVLGVIVAAVIVIALSIWLGKSRKRDLDRAMGKVAPDNKKTRDAKAAADARLAAEAEEAKAATAAEPAKSAESAKAEPAPAAQAEPEPAAAPKPESQPASKPTPAKPETPESVGSRLTRLKAKLAKSGNPFGKALFDILAKDNLSEADWEDVEDTLLLADVGADASAQLVDDLRTDARITGKADPAEVRATLKEKLLDLVGRDTDRRLNAEKPGAAKPSVIIMVGVNGTGKTTTAGKLARLFVAENKQVMMGAADTFRAAAADQLETWGARVNVPVVRSDKDGADPASVAFEASAKAKEANADVLIIDTAGRLQNKSNLMDELGKIRRVTEKNLPVDELPVWCSPSLTVPPRAASWSACRRSSACRSSSSVLVKVRTIWHLSIPKVSWTAFSRRRSSSSQSRFARQLPSARGALRPSTLWARETPATHQT